MAEYEEEDSDRDDFDPDSFIAYNFQPRRSERGAASSAETDEPGCPRSPPSEPELLESLSMEEWDGVDVETEGWRLDDRAVDTWCRCTNCQKMNTVRESVCCHDLSESEARGVPDDIICLTDHPNFPANNLNPDVLRSALLARSDILKEAIKDPIDNKLYRFQAYRQVTYWLHERLGKSIRRVIPSCVVKAIRTAYPEASGQYRGFLEVDEVVDFVYELHL